MGGERCEVKAQGVFDSVEWDGVAAFDLPFDRKRSTKAAQCCLHRC